MCRKLLQVPLIFLVILFCGARPALAGPLFLYKISVNQIDSYIFGTVHYGLSLKDLDPKISQLHRQCKNHFYETLYNPDKVRLFLRANKEPLNLFQSGIFVPAAQKGEKALTADERTQVIKLGVPGPIAHLMSRHDCDLVYYRKYLYQGRSLDLELLHHTFMMGKAPQALDTTEGREKARHKDEESGLDFTCDVGDLLPRPSTALVTSPKASHSQAYPKNLKAMDQYLDQLYADYRNGKAESFLDLTEGIKFRNRQWARQLLPYLQKESTFVTVGVYHLHGPDGLLALLANKGFEITRL